MAIFWKKNKISQNPIIYTSFEPAGRADSKYVYVDVVRGH